MYFSYFFTFSGAEKKKQKDFISYFFGAKKKGKETYFFTTIQPSLS